VSGSRVNSNPNISLALADLNAPAKTVLLFEVEGNTGIDVRIPDSEGFYDINYNSSPFGNGTVSGFSPAGGGTSDQCYPGGIALKYATGYMGRRDIAGYECFYTGKEGRHTGGANYLLGDGHAKWHKGTQVSSGYSAVSETGTQEPWQYGRAAGTSGTFPGGGAPAITFSTK
ncbi:MAG: hypothetical protein H7145_15230, partial [Akkermansiaceae bacterium]|nr:hypothetical protein [Armatimonadota bacterium]